MSERSEKRGWHVKLLVVAIGFGAVITALEASAGKWVLATDVQKYYRCLPFEWYVVTEMEQTVVAERGDLVRFQTPKGVERFTGAYEVIKLVAGIAGDRWEIREDRLYVNGDEWGQLHLMITLGLGKGALDGSGVVPEGQVYVLGTNPSSYDSRYWGPLEVRYITGKAHVVL